MMPLRLEKLWSQTVRAKPNAIAVIDAAIGREWSRAELAALAEQWSARHGAAVKGRRVVFAEPNGAEWLAVFLGIMFAEGTAIALDPGEPVGAQTAIAQRTRAGFIWREHRLERVGAPTRRRRGHICLIKMTSGSTGQPRALPFTDRQMAADGRQICATMGIKPADRNLGCIPFGHSYGLGNLVMPLLLQGTQIVTSVPVLPHALAAGIAQWQPTVFPAVPALLRGLVEADIEPRSLQSLRTIISAGAVLPPEMAQAFERKFRRRVHNFYGSSETGGISYDREGDATLAGRSVGRPMKGVTLEMKPSRRFFVRSAAVGGAGRFRPADRGQLNDRGELVLGARVGRMLKIAGRRLDPSEVERALREVPGVRDAFVSANPQRADSLAAAVLTARSPAEVREAVRSRLAGWKIPRRIVALPEFPMTERGKTDTAKLKILLEQTAATGSQSRN